MNTVESAVTTRIGLFSAPRRGGRSPFTIQRTDVSLSHRGPSAVELLTPVEDAPGDEVWWARDRDTGDRVVVKLGRRPGSRRALRRERNALSALEHPGIISLRGCGLIESAPAHSGVQRGTPYLSVEAMSGGSLQSHCGWLTWPELRMALLALLDALTYVHQQGWLHLDIKPPNVLVAGPMVTDGIVLADFGAAMPLVRANDATGVMRPRGTPAYMAPEQICGHRWQLGPWTDLYALGCLAFGLVNGCPPFGIEAEEAIDGHLFGSPRPLRPRGAMPVGLDEWISRLIHRRADQRYQDASSAAAGLRQLEQEPWRAHAC